MTQIVEPNQNATGVLVFAPVGRDAALTREFLQRASIPNVICRSMTELCENVETGDAGALLLTFGVLGFLALQRGGRLASRVFERGAISRLAGAGLSERLLAATREIDGRLAALHAQRPGDFRAALLLHGAGTSVGALQLAVFLSWLDIPYDVATLATVFSVGVALDLFSFFVPARLGAQDETRVALQELIAARGVVEKALGVVEKIREVGSQLEVGGDGVSTHFGEGGVCSPVAAERKRAALARAARTGIEEPETVEAAVADGALRDLVGGEPVGLVPHEGQRATALRVAGGEAQEAAAAVEVVAGETRAVSIVGR